MVMQRYMYEFISLSGKRKMRNDIIIILISEDVESMHMGPRCSFIWICDCCIIFPGKHLFCIAYNLSDLPIDEFLLSMRHLIL